MNTQATQANKTPDWEQFADSGSFTEWEGTVCGLSVTYRATLEPDLDTRPSDYEGYSADQIAAWHKGEWNFLGMVLSAQIGDAEFNNLDSLWGLESSDMPGWQQSYAKTLNEIASNLQSQAEKTLENHIHYIRTGEVPA